MDLHFTSGRLDESIGGLLRKRSTIFSGHGYVLLTSLDSITDLPNMKVAKAIQKLLSDASALGSGLVVPRVAVPEIAERFGFFHGFDEVWFFEKVPVLAKPPNLSIMAPLNLGSESIPHGITAWMDEANSVLGLGDGEGMNYVSANSGFMGRYFTQNQDG